MHGRVKVRTTAEQEKIKAEERKRKAAEYKKCIHRVFQKRKDREWDDEMLLLTEKMVIRNPDIYTLWNIRREVILENKWSEEESNERFDRELLLTETCLKENPKSYCVWNHRAWIIERLPEPNWKRELDLCAKFLNHDERNFHCWDYRQMLVKKANVPDETELEFTTTKILNNFSNYSSWHYRSKLLHKLYPSDISDLPIRTDKHDEELDLVMNATFTDPNDSSSWFYHRWLLDYCKSPCKLWRAVVSEKSATIAFHQDVSLSLTLFANGKPVKCNWKSTNDKRYSIAWYTTFEEPIKDSNELHLEFEGTSYMLHRSTSKNEWIYKSKLPEGNHNNPKLQEQLENYEMLSIMEPSNKWARLTSVFLMIEINFMNNYNTIIDTLTELTDKVDKLRANYYKDLRSKCILRYHLVKNFEEEDDFNLSREIDLSDLTLSSLSTQEPYFSFFCRVNLTGNCLGNRLHQLSSFRECKTLNLTNNGVGSLVKFPRLDNLEILVLTNNSVDSCEEVVNLVKKHGSLKVLNLKNNPVANSSNLMEQVRKVSSTLEVLV